MNVEPICHCKPSTPGAHARTCPFFGTGLPAEPRSAEEQCSELSMYAEVKSHPETGHRYWDCRCCGDQGDGITHDEIQFDASTFPVGTKLEIKEPVTDDAPLGKTRSIDQLPEKLQIEWLKAALVMAAVCGQSLEVWALNNPMAGNGQTRPAMPDMDFYPQDIQDRITKQRDAWINGGEANE